MCAALPRQVTAERIRWRQMLTVAAMLPLCSTALQDVALENAARIILTAKAVIVIRLEVMCACVQRATIVYSMQTRQTLIVEARTVIAAKTRPYALPVAIV